MRNFLTTLAFLLPFRRLKVRLLNRLGHDVHPTAWLGVSLVRNVRRLELAEGTIIGNFNIIRDLTLVKMGRGARIAMLSWISAAQSDEPGESAGELRKTLQMGAHSHILGFHYIECTGGVLLGEDCWIAGMRSTILSHAFDPHDGGMIIEPVELQRGAVLATSCTLLPGTVVEEGALLAAGSTAWTRQQLAARSLHGGVPARRLAPIEISDWVYNRHRYTGQG